MYVSDQLSGCKMKTLTSVFDRPRHLPQASLVQRVVTRCAHAHLLFCEVPSITDLLVDRCYFVVIKFIVFSVVVVSLRVDS